ncbi:hypothetical protein [Microbacterium shaanxiense]
MTTNAYAEYADRSESLDPVADVAALRALREAVARNQIPVKYPDRIASNNRMYGIKTALFGSHALDPGAPAIEHGLFFGDFVIPEDTVQTAAPMVATFSDYRKRIIERYQRTPVAAVGPYSRYAAPHYDDEQIASMKKTMGRTLLVFLSHGTHDAKVERTGRYAWLTDLAPEFDTILINTFWWDLLDDDVRYLEDQGFRIVSCGLTHDRNFLRRFRTLLMLADSAIGDGIGTHVGYCLADNVPYRYVDSSSSITLQGSASDLGKFGTRSVKNPAIAEVQAAFLNASLDQIEPRSWQTADKYWGFSSHKSPAELESILQEGREILRRSRGFARRFTRG